MNTVSSSAHPVVPRAATAAWAPELAAVASLSGTRYTVRLSGAGSGFSELAGIAITRWAPDETRDADGFHIYLRDIDDGAVWSAGYQPTRTEPAHYEFHHAAHCAEIHRTDRDIECRLTVCVSPQFDFEIRRCRLTNLDARPRRIELTSYLEWVLGSPQADASHPTFSKLFVETQHCAEACGNGKWPAILARRRPRHNDDAEFWGFHAVMCGEAELLAPIQFETSRPAFIGRGRTPAMPRALDPDVALGGEEGPVLDPIASLRLAVALAPGETREVAFILGAAPDRAGIDDLLAACGDFEQLTRIVENSIGADVHPANWNGEATAATERLLVHPPHRISEPTARRTSDGLLQRATRIISDGEPPPLGLREPLQFDNGYGGFSADGREYVIRLRPEESSADKPPLRLPPAPWVNIVANEQAGFVITERGAGYTWAGNSRENRLTAWHNDPVSDPHSEALWIRDEETGAFWSPTPGPAPAAGEYLVRHGFGYSTFEHESHELRQEVTLFVPRHEPVKLVQLRIVNRSGRSRRLSLYSCLHWALGTQMGDSAREVATAYEADLQAIFAANAARDQYGACVAFSAVRTDHEWAKRAVSYTCDRAAFLGRYGDTDAPAAVASGGELNRRSGAGLDPCAAWKLAIDLPPAGEFDCTYLLGEAASREDAVQLIAKYRGQASVQQALAEVRQFWSDTVSAIRIETPDREIDLMAGGWLTYQNLCCRIWARTAYYQPGGAFGFRDQLQDAAALVYVRPDITRAQILRHAAQQFVEGDVLHWWHADTGYGLRTRFSDDLLWLPLITAEFVERTGDESLWDEELPFLTAAPLHDGQQEAYLCPAPSGTFGSLYEHCCRALDRGLTTGPNGLPLIGCGDWNDGFSRVGRLGRGESVWLGFFIEYILQRMLPICSQRGDDERVRRYAEYRDKLRAALNSAGWDGAWYRRAYYDNGQPIGSAESDECQIDALAQAWAVISGVAPLERAEQAISALESRLVDPQAGLIRLLTPPFNRTPNDPGYIKGYVPGVRENGGQYTHGVLWAVRALAQMGRGTRAVELLRMLTPIWHTAPERVDVYRTEPYVVAADIYGEPPHVGRGGWTWYTGSAGWMFRVVVESIFGLSIERGRTLVINPSISAAWPACRMTYRLPDSKTRYQITIDNPLGREHGVREATLDGQPAAVDAGAARIPITCDGKMHHVNVIL